MIDQKEFEGYLAAKVDLKRRSEQLFSKIKEIYLIVYDGCVGETIVDVGLETNELDKIDGEPTIYVQTSYHGDDDNYYYFPAKYLHMTLEKIAEDVAKRKEAANLKCAEQQEKREYNEYLRLKAKFEKNA